LLCTTYTNIWSIICPLDVRCLTSLTNIFQLLLLWRKLEYPEKFTDLSQVTDKLYHIMFYRVPIILQQYCFPHNYGNCYAHIMSLNNVLKRNNFTFKCLRFFTYKSKEYNGMDILDSIFSDQRQKDVMN
jgi:hypothetical protein